MPRNIPYINQAPIQFHQFRIPRADISFIDIRSRFTGMPDINDPNKRHVINWLLNWCSECKLGAMSKACMHSTVDAVVWATGIWALFTGWLLCQHPSSYISNLGAKWVLQLYSSANILERTWSVTWLAMRMNVFSPAAWMPELAISGTVSGKAKWSRLLWERKPHDDESSWNVMGSFSIAKGDGACCDSHHWYALRSLWGMSMPYEFPYRIVSCSPSPKGEHSYLLRNLLGRVSMFAETYRIDDLQTKASMQNLNIAGCTYSLAIERLRTPPLTLVPVIESLADIQKRLWERLRHKVWHYRVQPLMH